MRRCALTVVIALVAGFMGAWAFAVTGDALHNPGSDYFADVAVDSPHNDDIGYAVEAGITMGLTPELFGSDLSVSRDQMASFQMRDLAAAMVLGIRLAEIQIGLGGFTDTNPTAQEKADMLLWAADLFDYEAQARPAEAIGGPTCYSNLATDFRRHAICFDSDGG